MQQELFYIAHLGQQDGPFSLDEIAARIRSGLLDMNDYVYDEASQSWLSCASFPRLARLFEPSVQSAVATEFGEAPRLAPLPAPTLVSNVAPILEKSSRAEWYVLKGENQFGPFSYSEILRMLQTKVLSECDYVWNSRLTAWEQVAVLPDFSPKAIRELHALKRPEFANVFFRRKYQRAHYAVSILAHDKNKLFNGHSVEIGAGGAGIIINNPLMQVGGVVYLHFKPGGGVSPFNARCELVSRRQVVEARDSIVCYYGVKFTEVSSQITNEIERYAKAAAA
jgi:hypothetical protein